MNKNLIISCVAVLFICTALSGCTVSELEGDLADSEKIIGTWRAKEEEYFYRGYTFYENGSCTIHTYEIPGVYTIDNGTLIVTDLNAKKTYTYAYIFFTNKKLTLNNEEDFESIQYIKQ